MLGILLKALKGFKVVQRWVGYRDGRTSFLLYPLLYLSLFSPFLPYPLNLSLSFSIVSILPLSFLYSSLSFPASHFYILALSPLFLSRRVRRWYPPSSLSHPLPNGLFHPSRTVLCAVLLMSHPFPLPYNHLTPSLSRTYRVMRRKYILKNRMASKITVFFLGRMCRRLLRTLKLEFLSGKINSWHLTVTSNWHLTVTGHSEWTSGNMKKNRVLWTKVNSVLLHGFNEAGFPHLLLRRRTSYREISLNDHLMRRERLSFSRTISSLAWHTCRVSLLSSPCVDG